ncbi:PliI family lysozyme inhibitor of I-type lysozyme [Dongshaea marina]|uniref:PliI family lysozyme inhibitor of I-type lysozyme n=1 Tax=Dongshaea marina TaxID=2047966 RepID=UPI000D3E5218|nr:PliI family lysozyme inhibitor of I-type lysozyme [Dongshaea marina]
MKALISLVGLSWLLLSHIAGAVVLNDGFVQKLKSPDTEQILSIAEGEFEPRSGGSYSVRLYDGESSIAEPNQYISGLIQPRDGFIARAEFVDLNGDGHSELVVVIHSATGNHLSADAYSYDENSLKLLVSAGEMSSHTNPLQVLRSKLPAKKESEHKIRVISVERDV